MSKVSCVSGDTGNGDGSVVVGTDKPVFSDDSGIRAAVLKWGVWVICFVAVLLGCALALTLRIHVSLPEVSRLQPPLRGQVERATVSPTKESSSQPPQPSITLRPSITFQPTDAAPGPTVKGVAPKTAMTSAARTRTPAPAARTTGSAQETTKVRNPKAANPTPRGSRPTSKPGNGPG
jgi:cytoskeletal protein RodZ